MVDVWLDGRWRLVDASGLAPTEGLVRIAVGRDATDIAFMTVFGSAEFVAQDVRVSRLCADIGPSSGASGLCPVNGAAVAHAQECL